LEANPAAITLHARTKKEMSKVPAHWDEVAKAVQVRNRSASKTLIVGNGDIKSYEEGLARAKETGCDGIMVGRGAFGNPGFFQPAQQAPSAKERLGVMLAHTELFEKEYGGKKPFVIMRKHFKAYASGFSGAHELRSELMETQNAAEVRAVVEKFLAN
jgi:tRNA-dihydrouridine synthase